MALLLDGSFAVEPIYRALKARFAKVYTSGSDANAYFKKENGDFHLSFDYSDEAAVAAHIDSHKVTHLFPGCTDRSLVSYSKFVNDDLAALVRHTSDKGLFSELCTRLNISRPRALDLQNITFPALIKPVDGFSGQGVSRVDDKSQLEAAIKKAEQYSSSGRLIVQEFVEGQLISCSAFVFDDSIHTSVFAKEFCIDRPYIVDQSFAFVPPDAVRAQIEDIVLKITRHFGVRDCFVHLQSIMLGDSVRVLEVMPRCPGDLYSRLMEMSYDMDYGGLYVDTFCASAPMLPFAGQRDPSPILRNTLKMPSGFAYRGLCEIPGLLHKVDTVPIGFENLDALSRRVAVIFRNRDLVNVEDRNFNELIISDSY